MLQYVLVINRLRTDIGHLKDYGKHSSDTTNYLPLIACLCDLSIYTVCTKVFCLIFFYSPRALTSAFMQQKAQLQGMFLSRFSFCIQWANAA